MEIIRECWRPCFSQFEEVGAFLLWQWKFGALVTAVREVDGITQPLENVDQTR